MVLVLLLLALIASTGVSTGDDDETPGGDGSIRERDLWHDSRDDLYRTPGGAVPAGTTVLLRLRTAAEDVSEAQVRLVDRISGESWVLPMRVAATDPDGGPHGYDYWEVEVDPGPTSRILDYAFVAQDRTASRHVSDDRALDGGPGQVGRQAAAGQGWQLTFYEPGFETPDWAHGAVMYQVFPDRFANGDPSNDPSPEATPGPDGAERYRRGDVYGDPVIAHTWDARPENYCRGYVDTDCPEPVAFNRDFFGGDLAGIIEHLDDIADLGVTAIYLNPVFASPSNHRYDTTDYDHIEPGLGTNAEFDRLAREAERLGIHVVLDGVFNHVSSDSPWFDRLRRFAEVGACESPESPYRDWFTFSPPGRNDPEPCAPTEPGGADTYYSSWFDFDTIPELRETPQVEALFVDPDGVVQRWIEAGASGWRLDAADVLSPAFMRAIRDAAKAADPDAIVIAEQWHDSTPWLLGDQADSTMNYRFRRAVISLVNGTTADPDGALVALSPTGFASAMLGVREDYPPPAYGTLMNLVDSHDTSRILWTLAPGVDNEEAKSAPSALAAGKASQRLIATLQLTFPGMPTIYYGDEVGLTGHDDPDNRRPYPWGAEDLELRDHYRTLARLRSEHEALRIGDLEFLHTDDPTRTLAYLRRTETAGGLVALNLGDRARVLEIDVSDRLPDGLHLKDALGAHPAVTTADGIARVDLAPMSAAVLVSPPGVDLSPPASPAGLDAEAQPGRVDLSWMPVDGATRYRVRRSLLSGGGYQDIGDTTDVSFQDSSVRDGVPYYYVVSAIDGPGNVSAPSAEAAVVPQLAITGFRLLGLHSGDGRPVESLRQVLSAVDGKVAVDVSVSATGESDRIATGIIVEVGFGPPGTDPGTDASWSWTRAEVSTISDDDARLVGSVQPEALGIYAVAARSSSDGGRTWQYTEPSARLEAVPGDDRDPPSAPGTPELIDVAGDRVRLRWEESDAADLHRYLVLRADDPAGPFDVIAATEAPVYLDASVAAGAPYAYAVAAQDTAFNTSPVSASLDVVAAERLVDVVFTVTVPEHAIDAVFIAGDFQGWDPAGTPMMQIDDATWSITLPFRDQESIQYKYARGSWDAVEKDAACAEIANRILTTDHGADGVQEVEDEVATWRDLDGCP